MRFMAIDKVSCASGPSAPSEMPGATRRLRSSVMDSTSSSGIGARSVLKSSRSRRLMGGRRRTSVLQHVDEVALEIVPVAAAPHLVEAADLQRDHVLVEGALMLLGDLLLHAAQ